jgi:hypothetical protein
LTFKLFFATLEPRSFNPATGRQLAMKKFLYALTYAVSFTFILWLVGPADKVSYLIMAGFGFGFALLHKSTADTYTASPSKKPED